MNLILYVLLIAISLTAGLTEIRREKNIKRLIPVIIILFVATAISRLGHEESYNDLYIYSIRFQEGSEYIFDIGYYYLCCAIRFVFGTNPQFLIGVIALINICVLLKAVRLIFSEDTEQRRGKWCISPGTIKYMRYKKTPSSVMCCCVGLILYATYWGMVYSTETLRQGLGITIMLLALAYAKKKYYLKMGIAVVIAIAFHASLLMAIPILLIIEFKHFSIKRGSFMIWLLSMVSIDLLSSLSSYSGIGILKSVASHTFWGKRLLPYIGISSEASNALFGYISTQYIFYTVVAIVLLCGDLEDVFYNNLVTNYYCGLTIRTATFYLITSMRIQWIFFSIDTLALLYIISNRSISERTRQALFVSYIGIQAIMATRYLGIW